MPMSFPVTTSVLPFPFSPSKINNPLMFALSPPSLGLVILVILVFISNLGKSGNLLYSHFPLTSIHPRRVPSTTLSPCVISVSTLGCFVSLVPGWRCPTFFSFHCFQQLAVSHFAVILSYSWSLWCTGVGSKCCNLLLEGGLWRRWNSPSQQSMNRKQ